MWRNGILYIFIVFSFLLLSGCYDKQVKHLASDVCLIREGSSTKQEVLQVLGEPDAQQMVAEGLEEWIYYEEDPSLPQKAPVVGEYFDAKGYGMIKLLIRGDVVLKCRYSSYEKGDMGWADDYSWQEEIKE